MLNVLALVVVGLVYVALCSLVPEPSRQKVNAVMVAGAGAAYLSGGALGLAELAFTAAVTFCAYRGLTTYAWLGVGWLLHTAWDVVHHLEHAPILPALADSSFGRAVCPPVVAFWLFLGAPGVWSGVSARRSATTT